MESSKFSPHPFRWEAEKEETFDKKKLRVANFQCILELGSWLRFIRGELASLWRVMWFALNGMASAHNKTSKLSTLAFVNYDIINKRTNNDFHHIVRDRCAYAEEMMWMKWESKFECKPTDREMVMN